MQHANGTTKRRILQAWCLCLLLCAPSMAWAQAADPGGQRAPLFDAYHVFKDALDAAVATADDGALDAFWQTLTDAHQVPFALGDSAAFLYRGEAESVAWNGDFNGWGGDAAFANAGTRLEGTDLWILETTFPADARLDYKIVRDGNDWILDPANPWQQWSGFGPNSELRMPAYVYPRETLPRPGVPQGTLAEAVALRSESLDYDVAYRVYTPAGYDTLARLPVLYVTDGHEYADARQGSLVVVLDNLIADGLVRPVLVVFVDPREPGRPANNRRRSEYADAYSAFAAFLAEELVPAIDAAYKTEAAAAARGILGTSLGGLFAAYVGAARPGVFRRLAIQSPAFFYDTEHNEDRVYRMYTDADRLPLRIFMSTGTVHDTQDGARRMRDVFEEKGYALRYVEVNEGHSWGNWRALLDDLLAYLWGV